MSRPTTPLPSTASRMEPLFNPPGRSSTHPVKPRHHVPHHPHRVHHHHHHHDKSVPQSAIQPTTSNSFGDFLTKTTSGLHDDTRTPPRRNEAAAALKEEKEKDKREKERLQWMEVERMRVKRTAVDEDLHTTLTSLSTLSTSTTRRLDYTYYSLLSSLSALTTTISDLHKLSTSTTDLSRRFTDDSTTLTSEINSLINTADKGFKQQARRIEDLEFRMKRGRQKVQMLGERLEEVRKKVEGSAERDREQRTRVERRLKVLWGLLGFWGVVVLVLVIVRYWPRLGVDFREAKLLELGNRSWVEGARDRGRDWDGNAVKSSSRSDVQTSETPHQDPVLRLFDEL